MLSFTLVSHIGYMVFGVGLATVGGYAGAIFYVVHHILIQTTLFLVTGLIERVGGSSDTSRLGNLAGIGPVELQYDCIGVGAGVKAEANNLAASGDMPKGLRLVPWNAGAGVQNLVRSLASEFAPKRIRVNSILIGLVESGQWR